MKNNASLDPILCLEDLHFGWREKKISAPLFDGASLAIYPGEAVGLWAKNGTGKTTLCHCILGILKAKSSRLKIMNQSLMDTSKAEWRAVLKQATFYCPGYTLNYDVSLKRYVKTELQKIIKTHRNWFEDLAQKLDFRDGKSLLTYVLCKSGEGIRLGLLVRALRQSAGLIILDEPFEDLPPVWRSVILEEFSRQLCRSRIGILCVSHHPDVLAWCHRSVTISDQKIVPMTLQGNKKERGKNFALPERKTKNHQILFCLEWHPMNKKNHPNIMVRAGEKRRIPLTLKPLILDGIIQAVLTQKIDRSILSQTSSLQICGTDILEGLTKATSEEIRQHVVFLPQAHHVFSKDVSFLDYFKMLFESQKEKSAEQFWKTVYDWMHIFSVPETLLTRSLMSVSKGQAQKLALIQGLLRARTKLYIMVAPYSGLDQKSCEILDCVVQELCKQDKGFLMLEAE